MSNRCRKSAALAVAFALLLAGPADALLFRAYVAPTGADSNPCTLPLPCRLLPAALAAVADGGEIWMLDTANYNTGPVDVTKSVTILAVPGAVGSVVANGGPAITIGTAGVNVALRNLVMVPFPGGGGTSGVNMTSGDSLAIDQCLIAGMPGSAVFVSTAAKVRVTDSTLRGSGYAALFVQGGAAATVTRSTLSGNVYGALVYGAIAGTTTTADITDSTIDGNVNGVVVGSITNADSPVKASVSRSLLANSSNHALYARAVSGAPVTLSASANTVSNNVNGISAVDGGKIWATGNTISDNATGFNNVGGVIESAGNNAVRNNVTDVSGTVTVISPLK
jgi:hypothetical protein